MKEGEELVKEEELEEEEWNFLKEWELLEKQEEVASSLGTLLLTVNMYLLTQKLLDY